MGKNFIDYDGHDYNSIEYTNNIISQMNSVLDSDQFDTTDGDAIFKYLVENMEIKSFSDQLKRFIYVRTGFEEPFEEIGDDVYDGIIRASFAEHHAPFSLHPTSVKKGRIIKGWLTSENVTREQVFTLAFGLAMNVDEVSNFLTHVVREMDFDFNNPEEAIYWACLYHGYEYSKVQELQVVYNEAGVDMKVNPFLGNAMRTFPRMYLNNPEMIETYLRYLKYSGSFESSEDVRLEVFEELYERARHVIADSYLEKNTEDTDVEITAGTIERILYSGVPVESNGNLVKISKSALARISKDKRLTRQRIAGIRKGMRPSRFDIITLLFLIYAISVAPDYPSERVILFLEEANETLKKCNYGELYLVNPYETFIIMCLYAEYPLLAFSDVWELSYL